MKNNTPFDVLAEKNMIDRSFFYIALDGKVDDIAPGCGMGLDDVMDEFEIAIEYLRDAGRAFIKEQWDDES